jgi:hypothetical protein
LTGGPRSATRKAGSVPAFTFFCGCYDRR